jgi:hypothetical protein
MPEYRVKRSKFTEDLPDIIELLASAWADAGSAARRRRILDSATRGQRLLCGFHFYWDDVTNGGHWQYFWNYTANLWPEALEGAHVLRLPEERILRDAISLFPGKEPALGQRERRQQLARIRQTKLDRLDDRFYALRGRHEQIRRYIDSHPDEFFLPRRSR